MEKFKGTDAERQKYVRDIWENTNKLYMNVQYILKDGMEKTVVEQKLMEASMWTRLYMEVEDIKPKVSVAIGTKEKTCECHGVDEMKCPARMQ